MAGVGMAVSRQDRAYKDYPSNPIPTSLLCLSRGHAEISGNSIIELKSVGMGLIQLPYSGKFLQGKYFTTKS